MSNAIKWYSVKAKVRAADAPATAEIFIYGDIGESWWGESVTAAEFVKEIAALDADRITVRINSYGGSVSDGIAIYNAIKRHKASVTVAIDGVAVSIASLIAMAGDTVEMAENALMMIHAPWGAAVGNSADMREFADVLDKYAQAMSTSYSAKSGKSVDDILALLTDGTDHWLTAAEAQAEGYVDTVTAALAAAASFDRAAFAARLKSLPPGSGRENPAAAAAQPVQETSMSKENPAAPQPTAINEDEIRAAAVKAERVRSEGIEAAFATFAAKFPEAGLGELKAACLKDTDCTEAAARLKILDHLGKDATPVAGGHVVTVEAEHDKQIRAAQDALLVRAGVHRMSGNGVAAMRVDMQGNPFRGATLLDLAKASLQRAGRSIAGMGKMEIVGQAFQTTSDFPILLENVMHKVLLQAYLTTPDTWRRFCKVGNLNDFRAHNRYRTGSIGNLDALDEHGEFKRKTIPDAEKGSITASTKGNIIGVTRQTIINDDLQGLTDLATSLGRAYKRTIEADVYALLAENSGLGPTLLDGKTLFHADHANLGSGAAISMAAIDADRVVMASQTGVGGVEILDLQPAKLLVPLSLGGTARSINGAQYDPDTANKLQKPNVVANLFDDIIDTARLSGTRRYLFADPNVAPVIEVGFLDGIEEPFVETKDGWDVDGAELKVRGDYGVDAIDYRGAVTNAGA